MRTDKQGRITSFTEWLSVVSDILEDNPDDDWLFFAKQFENEKSPQEAADEWSLLKYKVT